MLCYATNMLISCHENPDEEVHVHVERHDGGGELQVASFLEGLLVREVCGIAQGVSRLPENGIK